MSTKTLLAGLALAFLTGLVPATVAIAEDEVQTTFDGLVPVEGARVAMAYVDPNADFSVFTRVAILDPFVSFRSNWKRNQNRSRRRNLRASDVERIKTDVSALFRDVFIERLETAGFEIVTEAGEDVLVLRPAIIDLDVTAPETRTAGRSRTYTASAGAATLYIELIDSISGDILGRAADRRASRRGGMMTWSNRVSNRAEARRMAGRWADILVEFLQEHYDIKGQAGS
jgi:hypothetical protein